MSKLDVIAKYGVVKNYKKDDIVCMQGDSGNNMHVVLKGSFDVYINSLTDFPIKVSTITQGQFFGEMSMIDDVPRSATVIAGEDSLAISISKEDFKFLIKEDVEIVFSIMKTLSGRIRALNARLEGVRTTTATETAENATPKTGKLSMMPKGHKSYGINKPENYDFFVDERVILCPVCGCEFSVKTPNFSKLTRKSPYTQKDQRIIYENFDMLWYNIWVCPKCNYAEYYSAFRRISSKAIEALKASNYLEISKELPKRNTHNIDSVIEGYYLVLLCNSIGAKNPETEAKTWLKLYWLYGDANDNDNKFFAAQNALLIYTKIAHKMETDDKIQAYVIMAELAIALKAYLKAAAFYEHVCKISKTSNSLLYAQAVPRLSDLKAIEQSDD